MNENDTEIIIGKQPRYFAPSVKYQFDNLCIAEGSGPSTENESVQIISVHFKMLNWMFLITDSEIIQKIKTKILSNQPDLKEQLLEILIPFLTP